MLVVALRKIVAVVRPAALFPGRCRPYDQLGNGMKIGQFDGIALRRWQRLLSITPQIAPCLTQAGDIAQQPRILRDPAPTVLFDRSSADRQLEVVIGFSTTEADVPAAKSDLIRAVHDALGKLTTSV